mgnify:FL=1
MIALLPALGGSLRDLDRTGQRERVTWEFCRYAEAFDGAIYCSYADEADGFTGLGGHWATLPAPRSELRWITALRMVGRHGACCFATCSVARVLNFTGVLPALIAKHRLGLPFVLQYGYDYDALARRRPRLLRRRGRRLQYAILRAVAFRHADALIVTSAMMATKLRVAERYPDLPVHVIPNGVPLWQFWPSPPRRNSPPRVIYVGRLSPEKNLERLVQALALIDPRPTLVSRA